MEIKQIINWLRDKADRADNPSWTRMMHKAADRLNQLQEHNDALGCERQAWLHDQEMFRWTPVAERPPVIGQPVLVKYLSYIDETTDPAFVGVAVLLEDIGWYWWEGHVDDCSEEVKCTLTHWMPLPEPPKEVEHEPET